MDTKTDHLDLWESITFPKYKIMAAVEMQEWSIWFMPKQSLSEVQELVYGGNVIHWNYKANLYSKTAMQLL
jgi:hypothetical protein